MEVSFRGVGPGSPVRDWYPYISFIEDEQGKAGKQTLSVKSSGCEEPRLETLA